MSRKVCVYLICNDTYGLDKALASAIEAEEIHVADTSAEGSEAIKDLCDEYAAYYHRISVVPWRFDDARNALLALLPHDVDICVSLDSDEVLAEGWKEEILSKWNDDTTMLRYLYDWNSGVVFHQAKIHARSGYRWVSPCHETLTRYATGPDVWAYTEKFMMYHYPDNTKSRRSYLPLLVMAYKEAPHIPRNVLYLGREMFFNSLYFPNEQKFKDYGTQLLNQFIGMKMTYPAEKMYAYRIIGKMNGDEEAFKKALEENGKLPTPHRCPHVWYAIWLYSMKRWEDAYRQLHAALGIKDRTTDYMVDPHSWDGYPSHLFSWCWWHMGNKKSAVSWAEEACRLEPNNEYYKKCLERFEREEAPKAGEVVEDGVRTPSEEASAPSV